LIYPLGLVKPFLMLIRGERLEDASMYRGGSRVPGLVRNEERNLCFTFSVSEASVLVEGRNLMKFNRLFWLGKVTGTRKTQITMSVTIRVAQG
jgi:hypothetical protein